jgi:hypothetical protein
MSAKIKKAPENKKAIEKQLMEKWVLQSISDEAFFGMTEEEFDRRCNRLAYKELNGIEDAEVIASKLRYYKNKVALLGQGDADKQMAEEILLGFW